jgi:hypothetical protein
VQNIPRFGDIDLDGYADLMFNAQYSDKSSSNTVIMQNTKCSQLLLDGLKKVRADFDES